MYILGDQPHGFPSLAGQLDVPETVTVQSVSVEVPRAVVLDRQPGVGLCQVGSGQDKPVLVEDLVLDGGAGQAGSDQGNPQPRLRW
jgi:hypothetical protein